MLVVASLQLICGMNHELLNSREQRRSACHRPCRVHQEPRQIMPPNVRKWFDLPRLLHTYKRRAPLVLVNGLAEQPESWFANRSHLSRHFDVKVPEILVYDGDTLHAHIDAGGEVSIDYLADQLAVYLDQFVQRPPYHLVGSSLGCQVILKYAVKHPDARFPPGADLPVGISRRRELASHGRREAQPV